MTRRTFEYLFRHPFDDVVEARARRYTVGPRVPLLEESKVLREDEDKKRGVTTTRRRLRLKLDAPEWLKRAIGISSLSFLEKSTVDMQGKTMVIDAINESFRSKLELRERVVLRQHPTNAGWTVYKQEMELVLGKFPMAGTVAKYVVKSVERRQPEGRALDVQLIGELLAERRHDARKGKTPRARTRSKPLASSPAAERSDGAAGDAAGGDDDGIDGGLRQRASSVRSARAASLPSSPLAATRMQSRAEQPFAVRWHQEMLVGVIIASVLGAVVPVMTYVAAVAGIVLFVAYRRALAAMDSEHGAALDAAEAEADAAADEKEFDDSLFSGDGNGSAFPDASTIGAESESDCDDASDRTIADEEGDEGASLVGDPFNGHASDSAFQSSLKEEEAYDDYLGIADGAADEAQARIYSELSIKYEVRVPACIYHLAPRGREEYLLFVVESRTANSEASILDDGSEDVVWSPWTPAFRRFGDFLRLYKTLKEQLRRDPGMMPFPKSEARGNEFESKLISLTAYLKAVLVDPEVASKCMHVVDAFLTKNVDPSTALLRKIPALGPVDEWSPWLTAEGKIPGNRPAPTEYPLTVPPVPEKSIRAGIISRALSKTVWLDSWIVLYANKLVFFQSVREWQRPVFEVPLGVIMDVRRIEQGGPFHGRQFFEIETNAQSFLLCGRDEMIVGEWVRDISKAILELDKRDAVATPQYLRRDFHPEIMDANEQRRLVINRRRLVWDFDEQYSRNPVDLSGELLVEAQQIWEARANHKGHDVKWTNIARYLRFARATAELQVVTLSGCPHEARMAFFLNVYHTLMLHARLEIADNPDMIAKNRDFFAVPSYDVAGHVYSLSELEFGILRATMAPPPRDVRDNMPMLAKSLNSNLVKFQLFAIAEREPRLNFAINNGTRSAANVMLVFDEDNIHQQLDFCVSRGLTKTASFSHEKIVLPRVLDWFAADFVPPRDRSTSNASVISSSVSSPSSLSPLTHTVRFLIRYLTDVDMQAYLTLLVAKGNVPKNRVAFAAADWTPRADLEYSLVDFHAAVDNRNAVQNNSHMSGTSVSAADISASADPDRPPSPSAETVFHDAM